MQQRSMTAQAAKRRPGPTAGRGRAGARRPQQYQRFKAERRTAELLHVPYVAPLLLVSGQPPDPPEAHPSCE